MHNPQRGDVEIVLDGEVHVLRPSFQAICEIEAATGLSTFLLTRTLIARDVKVRDVAIIVAAGLKAAGAEGVKLDTVGGMLMRAGVMEPPVYGPVLSFLNNALRGGADQDPKARSGEAGDSVQGESARGEAVAARRN